MTPVEVFLLGWTGGVATVGVMLLVMVRRKIGRWLP